ncbi:hypothetical protein PVAP13_3KG129079 [Panicum virgatum]|uniref:Uncharacterized protein n=1 Tax=Panicum virgatum TaxID=38727 RepID=A0A8T0UZM8_PANVG|nr:hypothetical protein PVAP13_3KG129079 [Panicum virgatum]
MDAPGELQCVGRLEVAAPPPTRYLRVGSLPVPTDSSAFLPALLPSSSPLLPLHGLVRGGDRQMGKTVLPGHEQTMEADPSSLGGGTGWRRRCMDARSLGWMCDARAGCAAALPGLAAAVGSTFS